MHWAIEKLKSFCLKLENRIVWKKGYKESTIHSKTKTAGGHAVNCVVNRFAVIQVLLFPLQNSQIRVLRALRFLNGK